MKFSFTGRHMEIGEALLAKANESCSALAKKYGVEFIDVSIVMAKNNYLFNTDISAKTNSGNSYRGESEADNPHVSFESTLKIIESQIQKKKKCSCTTACRKESVTINSYDNSFEEDAPLIIAEILEDLPVLSVADAVKRLNTKKNVFIFENILNNSINVVYLRSDGNIGWIDYKHNI